jgi:hypothetical protein
MAGVSRGLALACWLARALRSKASCVAIHSLLLPPQLLLLLWEVEVMATLWLFVANVLVEVNLTPMSSNMAVEV